MSGLSGAVRSPSTEDGRRRLPEQTLLPAASEPAFDRFAELVRRVLDVPTAMVSLVDRDGQVFPGAAGLPKQLQASRRTLLSHSMCQRVVAESAPLVVGDAPNDTAWCLHPAMTDLGIKAYAGMPLLNRAGRVIGSLCAADAVARDWTEQQLGNLRDLAAACSSELQLREAAALVLEESTRNRELLASMPVGFVSYDREWRVVAANQAGAELAASTVDELMGQVLWQQFPATVGSELETIYRRVLETGEPEKFEYFYPDPLNSWFEICVKSAPPGVSVFYVDVTERHENETRADRILSEMPVGFVGLDQDFRITAANLLGAELVGASVDDLVGQIAWEKLPDLADSEFGQLYRRVARTGVSEVLEAYFPPPLDAWYDVRAVSHRGRLSLFYTDVTERRRIQTLSDAAAEHDRSVAHTLQQALLTALPDVPGIRLAARYLTAEETDQVGGDWYEAMVQPNGTLAISVGDVCGHGIEAAAAMGQLRSMLRAFLWDDLASVASALSRLDRVARGHRDLPFATVVSGRLELGGHAGPTTFVWSNAGHPPPLLLLPDGRVERCDAEPDVMIGIVSDARRADHVREVPPGSTLVFYTDGLIERRTGSIHQGIDRLAQALTRHHGHDLDELLDLALAELRDGVQEDDVAVLAVHVTDIAADIAADVVASSRDALLVPRRMVLQPDDTAPGIARRWVAEAAAGLSTQVIDSAVLLTSEAVTNAVRHGLPDVVLGVARDATGVLVSVRDHGAQLPVVAPRGALATGGRGIPIIDALATSWGVETAVGQPGKTVWFRIDESALGNSA